LLVSALALAALAAPALDVRLQQFRDDAWRTVGV
jgi:hypothetical protein